jgi:hypothetical protein
MAQERFCCCLLDHFGILTLILAALSMNTYLVADGNILFGSVIRF